MVWILKAVKPHKMSVKWTGPGLIVKRLSTVHYLVACPELYPKPWEYHVNSVKKYHEMNVNVVTLQQEAEDSQMFPMISWLNIKLQFLLMMSRMILLYLKSSLLTCLLL